VKDWETAKKIGANIAAARKSAGMQQIALAEKLGIGSSSVCNWEIGNRMPPLEQFIRLAEVLDVPVAVLFRGVGRLDGSYRAGFEDGWRQCAARSARAVAHIRTPEDRR